MFYDNRNRRYAFLVIALLFHIGIFILVWNLVVFPAPPVGKENTGDFAQVSIAVHTAPAPTPAQAAPFAPSFMPSLPVAPPMSAMIVTQNTARFNVPKVDLNLAMTSALVKIGTPHTDSLQAATGNTTSPNAGNSQGPACTSSTSVMESNLESDAREGANIGIFCPGYHPLEEAITVQAVVKKLPDIGWGYSDRKTNTFAIIYADRPRDPSLPPPTIANYGQDIRFAYSETQDIAHNFEDPHLNSSALKIKTFIMVSNFEDSVENPRPGLQKLDELATRRLVDDQVQKTANLISDLRYRHIRLCIITFRYAPYACLEAYAKESGGIILYPNGVPLGKAANQLKDIVIAK